MIDEMNKVNETVSELTEEEIGNVLGGAGMSAEADKKQYHIYCPKCRSGNTVNMGIETYHLGQLKVSLIKYVCRDCNQAVRILMNQRITA